MGSCDCRVATIKSHMKVHLNSGHDIQTATQMQEAIELFGCGWSKRQAQVR